MDIVDCGEVAQEFPDGTQSAPRLCVVFARNGVRWGKYIQVSNRAGLGDPKAKKEMGYLLAKAAREADRDIAFKLHGAHWREHCEYKDDFWDGVNQPEFEKFKAQLEALSG